MTNSKSDSSAVLDRKNYLPFHLVNLANGLSRSASKLYLSLFGVGVIEWRMLSILVIDSNVMATDVCQAIDLDAAAASRSINTLEKLKLVSLKKDDKDGRKRLITLTPKGRELHNKILTLAIQRQKLLLQNLSETEIQVLFGTLETLSQNLKKIQTFDKKLIIENQVKKSSN